MDGVFVRKIMKRLLVLPLLVSFLFVVGLVKDHNALCEGLIRLHVVASSDGIEDQKIKLSVRDLVLNSLSDAMEDMTDIEQAKDYIRSHVPQLEAAINETLHRLGVEQTAVVQFLEEEFSARNYETFSLPSGLYQSLRVVIGEGSGKNWWCVVFPAMCLEATTDYVEDVAAGAGFSSELTSSLTGEEGYEIRFFLLDVLGKIENFFHLS